MKSSRASVRVIRAGHLDGRAVLMAWNCDPKRWCDRAREMRSIAAKLKNPQAKAKMLRVAADYENIAQTAIERLVLHAHSTSRLEKRKQ
ncbi:MAG TPA: hypothetical protein VH684_23850 [Xanthobacteraceae bacterium]|jgi:hypothetical protein